MRRFHSLLIIVVALIELISVIIPATKSVSAIDVNEEELNGVLYPLYSDTLTCSGPGGNCVCGAAGSSDFSGENNAQIAFNFLVSKGLTQEVAAGFVGNFQYESTPDLDPAATNGNTIGIAQWLGGRKENLKNFAAATNRDYLSLNVQLEFVWFELRGDPITPGVTGAGEAAAYEAIIKTKTVPEATATIDRTYERSEGTAIPQRTKYAEDIYATYANGEGGAGNSRCGPGIGGINVFPLIVTKTQIEDGAQGATWCYRSEANCHHDYNAADVHAARGVVVIAASAGRVVSARERIGSAGSSVVIRGEDGEYTYYYTHMEYGSLAVRSGDTVTAGQTLGSIGPSSQAMGTAPHLHFDMLPQDEYPTRPSCSGSECSGYPFVNVQPILKELYETTIPN